MHSDRASTLPTRNAIERVLRDVPVPTRDGIVLATDVYLPRTELAAKPAAKPVILIRTPYGKTDPTEQALPLAKWLAANGFAVAVQDLRGTGNSTGTFKAYSSIEGPDGYDTLDWLVAQPWCNGRIGTVGCSYHGEVQDMLAALRHPNHSAAFIEGAYTFNDGTMRAFSFVRNGAVELAYAVGGDGALLGTLPLGGIRAKLPCERASYYAKRWPDMVHAWLTRDSMDDYWSDDGGLGEDERFDVPAIHMNEWYSVPFSSIRMFELYRTRGVSERARAHQYLIMSPVTHCRTSVATEQTRVGERDLGDARFDYFGTMLRWFDYWLADIDTGIASLPKVQAYLMGRNTWQSFDSWPPPGTQYRDYFLGAGGMLGEQRAATASVDSFIYDPANPAPSCGGPVNGGLVFQPGAFDQRSVEQRDDVLVYSTPVLEHAVQVSGRVEAVLYVSSSACDTDFTAKLVDVYPDGRAFNVLEGILRMRYRRSLSQPSTMHPGEVYEIKLDLDSTSNWFAPGHRIRLEVSSSNFPRFDRNLNTGVSGAWSAESVTAHNQVHVGGACPSRLILPVVPDAGASS
ncbi:CocE/NonD family hydrolase [Steroidobacter sp.]|uniref:CocE/NonD family hydrolase n=1 Tax=Steroidobacter sp. TaxID=1978227 RepID=UPI001A63C7C4|nr:CocE/NonD family hydrolase [Steroidobacter sp.]MBL8270933.1 CocE/NonD family hydrolase [Steroidobacter sp.]